jgi:PiT family inorganic phosphate transporter
VLASSGAVAFGIVSLLPVELILQVGSSAGYDMIFALLIAAIVWNLGTWWLGLPASSSHTLVGSIIGVGVANQLMAIAGSGTSGVDWGQAGKVFSTLLISPVFGFVGAAILLLLMKLVVHNKTLYEAPDSAKPPPWLIRGTLILTCTLVSFFHGSNDGQKGMGLIMLILIGALPTAYALNRTLLESDTPSFIQTMQNAATVFDQRSGNEILPLTEGRQQVTDAIRTRNFDTPGVYAGLTGLIREISQRVEEHGAIAHVPAAAVSNIRNDMYLASEAVRMMPKAGFDPGQLKAITDFKKALDAGTS